ncbi:transposase [Luteolibacter ambystomatis]|uniref:Transposase n=1 Tax=Luteolibacter ambystomatis TaxID=2824561 RepID=A0A975J3C6_9BACT|nr:transposase [Luteolibacter ambystomatis]
MSRSTLRYRPRETTPLEERLGKRMEELSHRHPRYGYRRIAALLRREGWRVGKRLVQRLRRACGLRVPPATRKRVPSRTLDRAADACGAPWPRLDVGLHRGCHPAWRGIVDPDDPR